VLTGIEPRTGILKSHPGLRTTWVWLAILIPLPILFHAQFLRTFIDPYFAYLHSLAANLNPRDVLRAAVLLAGAGHALVLVASSQVPGRLRWKEEFGALRRFNRKIFWTYGGFIVLCIVAFACADLLIGASFLDPNPSSLAIALFIAVFWSVRVVVDFTYFTHADWPPGDEFVIGHTCLSALFMFLALTHWGVVAWQLASRDTITRVCL
jgi:alginate O-acetyltransferase complex protein AlgI